MSECSECARSSYGSPAGSPPEDTKYKFYTPHCRRSSAWAGRRGRSAAATPRLRTHMAAGRHRPPTSLRTLLQSCGAALLMASGPRPGAGFCLLLKGAECNCVHALAVTGSGEAGACSYLRLKAEQSAKPCLTAVICVFRLPMHASRSFSQLLGQGALQSSGYSAHGGGQARPGSRQTVSPRSAVTVRCVRQYGLVLLRLHSLQRARDPCAEGT
jgi:hypothetical protein